MELKEPKEKRHVHTELQQPLPILISSLSGIPVNSALWHTYSGDFKGDCVVISTRSEMLSLYNMGYFGKGSLSRRGPEFGQKKGGLPALLRKRQWEYLKAWSEQTDNRTRLDGIENQQRSEVSNSEGTRKKTDLIRLDSPEAIAGTSKDVINLPKNDGCGSNSVKTEKDSDDIELISVVTDDSKNEEVQETTNYKRRKGKRKSDPPTKKAKLENSSHVQQSSSEAGQINGCTDDVLVVEDSDSDDESYGANLIPRLENLGCLSAAETLSLTLEEAFFLSYALGCLQVADARNKQMKIVEMWNVFQEAQQDFVEKYVVYHYFRSKGWVVKPGIRFGGDFLLYKKGPPFYHASYIILTQVVTGSSWTVDEERQPYKLTWTNLMGLNRVAEGSGKEVLLCYVIWPKDLKSKCLKSPECLPKFQVREILLRRWISSQEREEAEKQEMQI